MAGPQLSPSEFLDETADQTAAPLTNKPAPSEVKTTESLVPAASSTASSHSKKAEYTAKGTKAEKEQEGTVLPGGRIKISGKYRLAMGDNGDDFIVNDANADLWERNFRYLFGERLENTYDPAIYQKYLLNIDFSPQDKVNFYTQLVSDPWSWVGTTGEQEIHNNGDGLSIMRPNLKYFGAFNGVENEIFRTNVGDAIATPLTKVHDGHTTSFTTPGFHDFSTQYHFPDLDIDYEFRPVRKLWMDYTEDQWHARAFAFADQDQALTTDDPLELSNHKDFWQWSPWTEQYIPIQFFSDHSIKRGYYSNFLPYIAKDSEGNRLVLLRGVSFEGDYGKTYLAATVASPLDPWYDNYFNYNNVPGAIRLKHQVTDAWMVGGTYTFRSGLIDNSVADFGQVVAVDTKYQINKAVDIKAEVAGSHRDLDIMTDDTLRTNTEGYAYKAMLESAFDHKLDGHTDFTFSFTEMDHDFEPLLSHYYATRYDKFWGTHLTFHANPDLEYCRLGDGVDINRYVFRMNWREKLFKERFENLFDVRNVHRSSNNGYIETVLQNETTYHINKQWTAKGLFRWHGLPSTEDNVEPLLSNFYFDSNVLDQTRADNIIKDFDIPSGRDPSRFTYSGGLQWIVSEKLTAEGIVERSNDIPDFPRGLMGDTFRDSNDRVDGLLLDHLTNFLYGQKFVGGIPPYRYFTITKQRVIYKPEDRLTYTLHATQNSYKPAGGIDDNVNHIGLSVALDYTKKLSFFVDYTYSQQMDVPRLIATNFAESIYAGHHNFYASAQYKITPHQKLVMEYGVFGYGFESKNQPLISPYSGVPWALPTVDTEHLFRMSLEGEF